MTTKATKPNIVLILNDDMGFSDIGCYGGEVRNAQPGPAGSRRCPLLAVLQHGALLPLAGVPAHRLAPAPDQASAC